jgi:hypothetical protein
MHWTSSSQHESSWSCWPVSKAIKARKFSHSCSSHAFLRSWGLELFCLLLVCAYEDSWEHNRRDRSIIHPLRPGYQRKSKRYTSWPLPHCTRILCHTSISMDSSSLPQPILWCTSPSLPSYKFRSPRDLSIQLEFNSRSLQRHELFQQVYSWSNLSSSITFLDVLQVFLQ